MRAFIKNACMLAILFLLPPARRRRTCKVVYLKNGSVVRGVIIEQIPGTSIKIQTADGSVFAYKMEEMQKIEYDDGYDSDSFNCGGFSIKAGLDFCGCRAQA